MFGLSLALLFMALLVLLPLVTSARLLRLSREIEALNDRVSALEARLRQGTPTGETVGADTARSAETEAIPPLPTTPVPQTIETAPLRAPAVPTEASAPAAAAEALAASGSRGREEEDDLERRIGGRWLLYTGVLVLLLGVSFFLKYAFDNAWITETGRVVAGLLAGAGLIAGGSRLAAHGLTSFGQALIGTGLAILYLSIYAALAFYELIGTTTAFALMVMVTAAAAVLADRQRSQALAFIAVGGGFLTPFLVGGTEDVHLTLFTYDALLITGTLALANRHNWFALNALSYIFTFLTVLAWASEYYQDRLWLRTLLFLTLYCVMFLQILRATLRWSTPMARFVAMVLATAPVLYHITAVVLTARHPPAIHIYMIAFTAVGLWLTAEPPRPALRLLVLAGSYVPLFGTLTLPAGLSWVVANVVTIIAVASLHLMAPLDRALRQGQHLERSELFGLHAVFLGFYALLYETLARSYPQLRGLLGGLLAIAAAGLWRRFREHQPAAALNTAAIAFTLVAIAIAVQFDGPAVIIGWAAEGAAVAWIGLRLSNTWVQVGGLALWTLAAVRLLDGYFDTPAGFVAIFNMRAATTAFVVVMGYLLARLFAAAHSALAEGGRVRAALHAAASILTMIWITAEVRSYWEVRYTAPQAFLYEHLNLSLAWALYGALMIVLGMRRSYAPDRYIGITVLGITVLKVFFLDLWELGGIYRVVGFLAFGVLLVAVSYLYQRRRGGGREVSPRDTADSPA